MSKKHEIIFETDGRHSSVYLYEPPMGIRQYVEPIDEVLDLGFDTISYVVGDCAVLLYDTKVGEIWGDNYDLVNHEVWYKAAFNVRMMIDSGHDPLQVVCDHAHERGFNFLAHLLLEHGLHASEPRHEWARRHVQHPPPGVDRGRGAGLPRGRSRQPEPDVVRGAGDSREPAGNRSRAGDRLSDGRHRAQLQHLFAADRPPRGGRAHGDDYRVDAGCPPSGRRGGEGAGAQQARGRSHGRHRGRQQEDRARH